MKKLLLLIFGVCVAISIGSAYVVVLGGDGIHASLLEIEIYARSQTYAGLGFVVIQLIVAGTGVLPASLLCIIAGSVFGIWTGLGISITGTMLGAILGFLLARSIFRKSIEHWILRDKRFKRIDAAINKSGWRVVLLLRLSPIMPFALTSLSLGLTSIPIAPYMLGTFAALPSMAIYVMVGASIAESAISVAAGDTLDSVRWMMWLAGAVVTMMFIGYLGRILSRAWSEPIDQ